MEFARGAIGERPWGAIFAGLALDEAGCELLVEDGAQQYVVAFERNAVIAATSPQAADSGLRVALTHGVISPATAPQIMKRLQAEPAADTVDLVAEIAGLDPDMTLMLRRRVIAQAAMRTFAITHGTYRVQRAVSLRIRPHAAIDVRAVVFSGLRTHVPEAQLAHDLTYFGNRFVLRANALESLPQYGFTSVDRPLLGTLQAGGSIAELESLHPELGPSGVRAVVYALVACREVDAMRDSARHTPMPTQPPATAPAPASRASQTMPPASRTTPPPFGSVTPSGVSPRAGFPTQPPATQPGTARGSRSGLTAPPANQAAGVAFNAPAAPAAAPAVATPVGTPAECYERGLALLSKDIPRAVIELTHAAKLSKDPDHIAAMAWAVFCSTTDKPSVAKATRMALGHAIFKSEKPELARFYLGRVERMLGRDREALEQFKAVIELVPRHPEALAEIRTLEARFAAEKPAPGLFQRKR